jgi:hypothetical protein
MLGKFKFSRHQVVIYASSNLTSMRTKKWVRQKDLSTSLFSGQAKLIESRVMPGPLTDLKNTGLSNIYRLTELSISNRPIHVMRIIWAGCTKGE